MKGRHRRTKHTPVRYTVADIVDREHSRGFISFPPTYNPLPLKIKYLTTIDADKWMGIPSTTSDSKPPPDRTWVEFETAFRSKNSKDTEKR